MKVILIVVLMFLFTCSKRNDLSHKVLGIQVYKGFPESKAISLAEFITKFYTIKTIVLKQVELPKVAFINIKSPRYRADSILKYQNRNKPDTLTYILGLTISDISVTKRDAKGSILKPQWKYNDFGVMGLANCPGNSAVVSTYRLKTNDEKLALNRLQKVAIHEIGHNLGLTHCSNVKCVMTSAAEKIATIDLEALALCSICKNKVKL